MTRTRDGKRIPNSRLIVTDRRLVLLVPRRDLISHMFGLLGAIAAKLAQNIRLEHQIKRADFRDVEEQRPGMLVFHNNKGEGYAHISFDVYDSSSLAIWQQRMHAWVAGHDDALTES